MSTFKMEESHVALWSSKPHMVEQNFNYYQTVFKICRGEFFWIGFNLFKLEFDSILINLTLIKFNRAY